MAGATIEQRLDAVAGELNATQARLVDLAIELVADPSLWRDWECGSLDGFISWRCGVHRSIAAKIVAVARRAADLPHCLTAFRDGMLSLDQIAPIARHVPHWADVEICRQAQMMTVAQIARTASKYPFITDIPKPDGTVDGLALLEDEPTTAPNDDVAGSKQATPVLAGKRDSVWFAFSDDGRFHLNVDVDAATGSIIDNALTEARDGLFQAGAHDVSWVDALREVSQRSLDTIETPQRRTRFHTLVHRDVDGVATSATGCGIEPAVADYMTCDGLRTDVFEVDGIPISVGRTQRIVPERTRRVVIHRDGGCRVPGCDDHRWLDVHHIIHWANGGPTDTDNLVALCSKHHRLHHRGLLGIEGNADQPDGVIFTNRHGRVIAASGARPTPPGQRSATEPSPRYKPALRERIDTWSQHFNLPEGHRHRWSPYVQGGVS